MSRRAGSRWQPLRRECNERGTQSRKRLSRATTHGGSNRDAVAATVAEGARQRDGRRRPARLANRPFGVCAGAMKIDDRIGDAIEGGIGAHHRRRLRRIGWEPAFDARGPAWARGDPPPRSGNAVEVLVDGAQALPRVAEELRRADSHVYLAGWHVTPTFRLGPSPEDELLAILAERAEHVPVRVLLWAGAPLPLFRPSRGDVRELRDRLERGTRIRVGLDARERPMHCHHEKLVVVDDRVAFVGGIDLTSYAGDRLDANHHPARGELGWHDAAARLEGPVVADVAEHFALRWREVTGEALAAPAHGPAAAGGLDVQLVRTV